MEQIHPVHPVKFLDDQSNSYKKSRTTFMGRIKLIQFTENPDQTKSVFKSMK